MCAYVLRPLPLFWVAIEGARNSIGYTHVFCSSPFLTQARPKTTLHRQIQASLNILLWIARLSWKQRDSLEVTWLAGGKVTRWRQGDSMEAGWLTGGNVTYWKQGDLDLTVSVVIFKKKLSSQGWNMVGPANTVIIDRATYPLPNTNIRPCSPQSSSDFFSPPSKLIVRTAHEYVIITDILLT